MKMLGMVVLCLCWGSLAFSWEMNNKGYPVNQDQMMKEGRLAEAQVKALPCKEGGTVDDYLNKKASIPAIEDLGWATRPRNGGFEVERLMLLNKTMQLIYRWSVDSTGKIKPLNGKAISITKE